MTKKDRQALRERAAQYVPPPKKKRRYTKNPRVAAGDGTGCAAAARSVGGESVSRPLSIAPDLALPLDAVTTTIGILSMRGAGKSNTAAVLAEEMFAAGLPFVVIDPVGAWYGLRSSADGKGPGLPVPIFGGRQGDVPLEKGGGQFLADLVVDQRLSCVLDLSDLSEGDKIQFLIAFAERLYRRNQDPLHLFLEEADDYIPQRPFREQARLLRAWENIVRRGRGRGLGITMVTQRSAAINKNVLTQVETLIVLRTTSPQDRKAIEEWVKYHDQDRTLLESLPGLANGEAWVWSPHWLKLLKRVQIRRRHTFDSGATPKDVKGGRPIATKADVDLALIRKEMADTIERAKAEDPRGLRKTIAQLKGELKKAQVTLPAAVAKVTTRVERIEVPVLKEAHVKRLEAVTERWERAGVALVDVGRQIAAALRNGHGRPPAAPQAPASRPTPAVTPGARRVAPAPETRHVPASHGMPRHVTGVEQRILNALAELELLGALEPNREMVAFLAGYSHLQSKGFVNGMSALRTAGKIDYPSGGSVALTEDGRGAAEYPEQPRSPQEVQQRVIALLGGASARILEPLIAAYPNAMPREEVAHAAGYGHLQSKGFVNAMSRLRTLGFIDYPDRGSAIAKPVLFLER